MRDDLEELPLPLEAKAYARRRGLAAMKRQPQEFINVMATLTNQKHLKPGFRNTDAGGKVPHAIKERAAEVVRIVLEDDDEEEGIGFKDVYHPSEQTAFKVYSRYDLVPGHNLNIEWNFQVPSPVVGGKYVNRIYTPFGMTFRAQQVRAIQRMKTLAQERQWPVGAEFVTSWGRYLIQNGTITKI